MRFYIPIGDGQYLCIENGRESSIVRGEPDPFSRVTCPPILWDRVKDDLPYLTKSELDRAMHSEVAYTRLWVDPD
jgi:hypothetical protein